MLLIDWWSANEQSLVLLFPHHVSRSCKSSCHCFEFDGFVK